MSRKVAGVKPLAIDLFCGLGGFTEGFLAEGYDCIGFDIERHVYGDQKYPAQLVLQDVLTLHGSQFRNAAAIVASPPCQAYSYRAMPWKRAKALPPPDNTLFDACFRIQREALEAAGRYIPMVVENVKGAQPWVGRARWHYGSFYLWGDVPALMPFSGRCAKVPGLAVGTFPGGGLAQGHIDRQITKNTGGSWFGVAHNTESGVGQNPVHELLAARRDDSQKGLGGGWFDKPYKERGDITGRFNSKSASRKAASAQIAKIPFLLAQYIARTFKPLEIKTA